ncbi:uncharacterized protein LOC106074927 [Biomphalaria glabrata]|uniref:Uncharacterized protein LOC106074927 n=1 Tax=Biomphalaria glabrata TaxID=6526 RepID=A0A9W2Z0Z5_BIOGL|nr:uncharacterized protein LOC106074927 [Biomphalaria glabrata]
MDQINLTKAESLDIGNDRVLKDQLSTNRNKVADTLALPEKTRQTRRHSLSTSQQFNFLTLPFPNILPKSETQGRNSGLTGKSLSQLNLPDLLQDSAVIKRSAPVRQPLFLPPPPAAHLPPSLPSRPPAGTPWMRPPSSLSFRPADSTQSSPGTTPLHLGVKEGVRNSPSQPNLLFRSCGTIKIEEPSTRSFKLAPHIDRSTAMKVALPEPTKPPAKPDVSVSCDRLIPSIRLHSSSSSSLASSTTDGEEETSGKEVPTQQQDLSDKENLASKTPLEGHQELDLVQTKSKAGRLLKKDTVDEVRPNIIPPEISSLRHSALSVADIITSALLIYRKSQIAITKSKNKPGSFKSGYIKPPQCFHCDRNFGLFCASISCSRCKKSFCERCVQKKLVDSNETGHVTSGANILCILCIGELERETSRGVTRGLWSEFQKMRTEAKVRSGQPLPPANTLKQIELQDIRDLTPGLHQLCLRFLKELHRQLARQKRHSFFISYLQTDLADQRTMKTTKRIKDCPSCGQQLRLLQDIMECNLCQQLFCSECTYPTLQLYLPSGTELNENLQVKQIKVHVLACQQDEVSSIEASEVYRVCEACETLVQRNTDIIEFNHSIQDIEQEMFDLQRQIDDALSYNPLMLRSRSTATLNSLTRDDEMTTSIKMANKLYERYTRQYESLDHMSPQTPGQKILHKHVKQAMYEFYLKRRNQLRSSLRLRDSRSSLME